MTNPAPLAQPRESEMPPDDDVESLAKCFHGWHSVGQPFDAPKTEVHEVHRDAARRWLESRRSPSEPSVISMEDRKRLESISERFRDCQVLDISDKCSLTLICDDVPWLMSELEKSWDARRAPDPSALTREQLIAAIRTQIAVEIAEAAGYLSAVDIADAILAAARRAPGPLTDAPRLCYPFSTETCDRAGCQCRAEKAAATTDAPTAGPTPKDAITAEWLDASFAHADEGGSFDANERRIVEKFDAVIRRHYAIKELSAAPRAGAPTLSDDSLRWLTSKIHVGNCRCGDADCQQARRILAACAGGER